MTEEEYRFAIAQQQAAYLQQERERALELMRAQDRATGERIREMAHEQAAGFAAFTGTAYYPYDIAKPEHPPMKQANARVIEPPQLPEK